MSKSFTELKKRISSLAPKKKNIFGYSGHKLKLNKVTTEAYLVSLETRYRVELPIEYRDFLLTVGDGGAGPGYGLESLESGIAYERSCVPDDILSTPFEHQINFKPEEDRRYEETYERCDRGEITEEELDRIIEYITAGTIVLCHEGCGYLHRLVVNGPAKGEVWMDAQVTDHGLGSLAIGFYEWYEKWVEHIEDGGNGVWWMG